MVKPLITANVLAERLSVSTNTIRRWVQQGRIPHIKLQASGGIRFDPFKIEEWLEGGTSEVQDNGSD